VGRLDKDSSGLLLLTNDGQLAYDLTHPSSQKEKIYEIKLEKPLTPGDKTRIEQGLMLEDGVSKLALKSLDKTGHTWQVTMHEGRNRQIRRTFATLDYDVQKLHRVQFGPYRLKNLAVGSHIEQS
jgi:23S rRNA pseudouridine2605 synthase